MLRRRRRTLRPALMPMRIASPGPPAHLSGGTGGEAACGHALTAHLEGNELVSEITFNLCENNNFLLELPSAVCATLPSTILRLAIFLLAIFRLASRHSPSRVSMAAI